MKYNLPKSTVPDSHSKMDKNNQSTKLISNQKAIFTLKKVDINPKTWFPNVSKSDQLSEKQMLKK